MQDSERKAWEALSAYKFIMFGYHASRWVNYKELLNEHVPNPFHSIVIIARQRTDMEE